MGSMQEFWLTEMGKHSSTPGKTLEVTDSQAQVPFPAGRFSAAVGSTAMARP